MDKVPGNPSSIRGLGNVISRKSISDFDLNESRLISSGEMDNGEPVLKMVYSVISIVFLNHLDTTLVKNLSYSNGNISYDVLNTRTITSFSDLDGVIYDLEYTEDNDIEFKIFNSNTIENVYVLMTAVTSLTYNNNGDLVMEVLGDLYE